MPDAVVICPANHIHAETSTCYVTHCCRCDACRQGRAEYSYWARHMVASGRRDTFRGALIDATPTRRRIQALMALGWSQPQIAKAAGSDQNRVSSQLHAERITRGGAAKVAAAYELLSFRLPPTTTRNERVGVNLVRALARRNRWLPPLAWDDIDNDPDPRAALTNTGEGGEEGAEEAGAPAPILDDVAIDLAIQGHPVHLTPAERRACVAALHAKRYSDPLIAETIRCNVKTVGRIRDELHLPAHEQDDDVLTRRAA